ncbi:amidohydrolase [Anaerobacillus arseniciselenatis]|uniref:Amidohydrolase n=1 Tax=Anaerobacillus arseniciselenatis TaxID=85682 RepID=A0A1S2LKT6_9BACI|nr:amidohydrolase [Anaerobacillus arseniciselenatis]OIJ12307.1 amidohydrolase [Anaerobacillus arseniciselenatis]
MQAYINATIIVGNGEVLKEGTLLVESDKIKEVGLNIDIPDNAEVFDLTGKTITPGIIDVHTHLGVHEEGIGPAGADFNEITSASTPYVRALDGINPMEKGFEVARQSGVTTVQILPGSANVIGGEIITVKTVGTIVDEMIVKSPSGMKAAFGENPKRVHGEKTAKTRMGVAAVFRQEFIKAQNYLQKLENGENVPRDLGLENLVKVLKKEIPLRAHAHRADDIVTLLRLVKEFDIDVTIEHCTEGHKIADYIKKHDVIVAVGPTMSSRSKVENADKGWHTLLALEEVGVPFAITTDHPVVGIEYLITSVAQAVKNGLNEASAWKSVTLNAAKHIGIEDRLGSLEKGKDADLVIWSSHPFDVTANVEKTIIDGEVVFEA